MKTLILFIFTLSLQTLAHDSALAWILNTDKLNLQHKIEVCLGNTLIVFIAGVDSPYAGLMPGSVLPTPSAPSAIDLTHIIEMQVRLLKQVLTETDCGSVISDSLKEGKPAPKAVLLTITDYEEHGDTKIETTYYEADASGQMRLRQTDGWISGSGEKLFEKGNLKENPYELHLPTQLEASVRYIKTALEIPFDQTLYLIKAHGMPFASKEFDDDLLVELTQEFPEGVKLNHSFMFDKNGPEKDGEYSSGLRHPYWMPLDRKSVV